MSVRRKLTARTVIDMIVLVLGLVILGVFLNSTQTKLSIHRQQDNFKTKLDIAEHRLANNAAEAQDNLASYDAFSQAKLDSVASFLESHPGYGRADALAQQWGLKQFYLLDAGGRVTYSLGAAPDFSSEPFKGLLENLNPVTQGYVRFYARRTPDGGYAVGGRDCAAESAALENLRSASNALKTIKVGSGGFIIAIEPESETIAYTNSRDIIGQPISAIGLDFGTLTDGYEGWLTLYGQSYYAHSRAVDGYILIAVVPESEMTSANNSTVALALIVFAVALLLMVAYAMILRRDEATNPLSTPEYIQLGKKLFFNKTMGAKMRNVALICLIAIFALSFYMQTLSALSRQSLISTRKLEAVADILDDNESRIASLTDEYKAEYVGRAKNIAWTLAEDPALINDDSLMRIAENAQVSAIYVFDENGRTVATNTNYKDFRLSDDKDNQSYPFWSVAKGYVDVYVQEAQPDDTPEANMFQYVGVKRLDDGGMVQLGLLPRRLKNRLAATEWDYVLKNIAVENGGYLFAVSKADGTFLSFPKSKFIGRPALENGLTDAALHDEFSGYQTIDGVECFVTCAEYKDAYLFTAVPLDTIYQGRLDTALIVTASGLIVILILCAFLLISRKMNDPAPEKEPESDISAVHEARRFFRVVTPGGKTRVVQSAASRWSGDFKWSELTAEQKLTKILGIMLGVAAIALAVWTFGGAAKNDSVFSYILATKWEKTPNIFSLTYILLIAVEVLVASGILRKIVLYATGHFGARSETVGRLLDSFIKYVAVIGIIFYGLNFLGIDSATLMTSAGILALVVGLGAQKLIGDILAGMFIVFEGEFRVGDIVTVGDWCGTVLEIGIRTTKIQRGGDIKIISNSSISGVVNMTKQFSFASADIGIEYGESLERVEAILKRELPLVKERVPSIISGPFYNGVASLGDSAVIIRVTAQCREKDRAQLCRDLNRELKLICDHNDVSIPFPQIVVNQPVIHAEATRTERNVAAEFVEEQKELSKDMHVKEGN